MTDTHAPHTEPVDVSGRYRLLIDTRPGRRKVEVAPLVGKKLTSAEALEVLMTAAATLNAYPASRA